MSARAKKKNLFGTPKALAARQTTAARGGVAAHVARGATAGPKGGQGTTLGTYQGYRIWKDAEGEYRFSGDPDSAFASLRVVKGHIDWLRKGRGNPAPGPFKVEKGIKQIYEPHEGRDGSFHYESLYETDDGRRFGFLSDARRHRDGRGNPAVPQTAVVESEIPVFRSGPAGFPGVDYMISYPELNQAIAYAQAVKGAYPHVGVVCLEEAQEKQPGGDYAVVLDAAAVRAVEAGQVGGTAENPRGMWPVPYEVDEGVWYGAAHLALRSRTLSPGAVEKAAAALIDELYGGNAVVAQSQVDHIHTLFRNSYEDARRMSTKELRKLATKRAEHLKRVYLNPAVRSHAHLKGYEDGHAHVGYLPDDTELAKQAGRQGARSREDVKDYVSGFKAAMTERRRNPRARIVEYDGMRWKVVGTVKTGVYAGQIHLRSLSDDSEAIVDPSSVQTVKGPKPNPEDAAAEMYESFHGREADRVVEVTEELHEHEWLADLGALVSLHIETPTGLEADLEFTSDAPKLASNEAGTQLFVVGGKQTINLKPLKMDGPDWRKESMVLGWIWVLTYNTEKDFDKFESIDYYHKLSETERGSLEKRRKTLPSLRYDSVNEKLYIDGGKYRIEKPLVGTSPGIEN